MDYTEAKSYIDSAVKFGSKLGLETITALCARLGNPQDSLRFVHVAGTNGKGSTCTMISSILTKAGYKTGLFLSPHMAEHRDSVLINGEMMSETAFAESMTDVKAAAEKLAAEGIDATEFELLTACALFWFRRSGCDIVVLETGLGGRLDATNVVQTTLVSVITAIAMDHMQYLGDTIEQIAQEKCGIIKPGRVTVSYADQPKAAMSMILSAAAERENVIIIPDSGQLAFEDNELFGVTVDYRGIKARLRLPGRHQAGNAAMSIETAFALRERYGFDIPDDAVSAGLEAAYLPARHELLCRKPLVLLDGAHNLQGIEALADSVKRELSGRRLAVIMGMLRDKQYDECIGIMAHLADKLFAVKPDNARALEAEEVAAVAGAYGCETQSYRDMDEAVRDALAFCGADGALVICGSLYMADKMRNAIFRQITFVKHSDT